MKCGDLDKLVIFTIILSLLGDVLALLTALFTQRCDRQEELESDAAEKALLARLQQLEQRINKLENP